MGPGNERGRVWVRGGKVWQVVCLLCVLMQRYADVDDPRAAGSEAEGGGGVGGEEMFVVSRNSLVTPVEMVGADKINKKTRLATDCCKILYDNYPNLHSDSTCTLHI